MPETMVEYLKCREEEAVLMAATASSQLERDAQEALVQAYRLKLAQLETDGSAAPAVKVVHLSGRPRKRRVGRCGWAIDGVEHVQTMLPGQVDCPECQAMFHLERDRGGFSQRAARQ